MFFLLMKPFNMIARITKLNRRMFTTRVFLLCTPVYECFLCILGKKSLSESDSEMNRGSFELELRQLNGLTRFAIQSHLHVLNRLSVSKHKHKHKQKHH